MFADITTATLSLKPDAITGSTEYELCHQLTADGDGPIKQLKLHEQYTPICLRIMENV